MSRFPTELYERIIDHLWDDPDMLRSCSLVCRSMVPRSRLHLFADIRLSSSKELAHFVHITMASSITDLSHHVKFLKVLEDPNKDKHSYSNLAFYHLSGKFPHLQMIEISSQSKKDDGEVIPPLLFPFHSSTLAKLSHFRSVQALILGNYRFGYFTDLQRVVSTLPSLMYLECLKVSWDNDSNPPRPLVRASASRLSNIYSCNSDVHRMTLWFWATASSTSTTRRRQFQVPFEPHPVLRWEDAHAMNDILLCVKSMSRIEDSMSKNNDFFANNCYFNFQKHWDIGHWVLEHRYSHMFSSPRIAFIITASYDENNPDYTLPNFANIRRVEIEIPSQRDNVINDDYVLMDSHLSRLQRQYYLQDVVVDLAYRISSKAVVVTPREEVENVTALMEWTRTMCRLTMRWGGRELPPEPEPEVEAEEPQEDQAAPTQEEGADEA